MLLGLDLGTTNVKAVVTDLAGQPIAHGSCSVPLRHGDAGGTEQEIEEIWQATLAALRQALGSMPAPQIQALGVSSQGGAMQVMDAAGRPVGRVLSWLDQRGRSFDDAVTAELGRDWFIQHVRHGRSGMAIGQWLRLTAELSDECRASRRVGFVGDVIVSRLCGRGAHDGTSGALTLLYNPQMRDYDPDLLVRLGLTRERLPDLVSPREAAGGLLAGVAQDLGLRPGIPVSGAVHDQYAAALAAGAVRAGRVMVGTGTAWVLLAVGQEPAQPVTEDAYVCHHVVEGLHGQILSLVNGGSALSWALEVTGQRTQDPRDVERLLESVAPGCAGVRCWPFLVAAGATGLASGTLGRWSGLQLSHQPAHLVRAVVEGLAFELKRHLDFLQTWSIERLVLTGGAASGRVTPQILADVTGLPLACAGAEAGSALGAAILARGLLEPKVPLADLAESMVPSASQFLPGAQAMLYQKHYREYRDSLPAAV